MPKAYWQTFNNVLPLTGLQPVSNGMDCQFCNDNIKIDYKNRDFLRKFVTSQFKIATSRRNKICNKHQREISTAVKNARFMALIPYTRLQVAKRNLSR